MTFKSRLLVLILFPFALCINASAQSDSVFLNHIVNKLSLQPVTEKAYLHFDKPYYAAGDTIYFKAYITLGERHQQSNLSGVLHVDLINTTNKIDQSMKLQVIDGVAWGDFALPDTFPNGNYRIRAYTQWMRNSGDDSYFDQIIPVGSIRSSKVPESSTVRANSVNVKPDLQFFPEGGNLIIGIHSKVVFKAIGTNGLGINVTGVIVENENKEITTLASAHLGMGYFYLDLQEGKTYKAKLTFADGSQSTIDLPKPEAKGIMLSVNNDSLGAASVKIEANKALYKENKNKDYSLVIYSGGIATTVSCKLDTNIITLDILKRRLHTGIATVTLFSPTGEPLSERLLFIQNHDQLSLNINGDKTSYTKGEKVNIKLNVKDRAENPSTGHFSVSVIDESKVPTDENSENTILTNLLLTSDLKGEIEQPNYYFTNITSETLNNLDLVMLTHGYRRFEWKKLLDNSYPPVAWQPESGLEINGKAKTLIGKPLVNRTVSLISPMGGSVISQTTDAEGNFRFSNLLFSDTAKFVLQAVNAKGKNTLQLVYNKEKSEPAVSSKNSQATQQDINQSIQTYVENSQKQQEQLNNLGLRKGKMLSEVKIKAKKIEPLIGRGKYGIADQVIRGEELEPGGQLLVRLMGKLHGVHFESDGNSFMPYLNSSSGPFFHNPMGIIIDGFEKPKGFDINSINTSSIETIEVMNNGTVGMNGILLITTKQGLQPRDITSTGVLPIKVKGFYKAREFYAPKYESSNLTNKFPDLRSTIYWKPELITDKDGNASFEYYNVDGTGTYRVVIEGIDEKGNLGKRVYRYKVE